MHSSFERGEVCWFDFSGHVGSEADDIRPAVILQANWIQGLHTVIAVPCSKEIERRKQPTCVFIPSTESDLPYDSVAVCHLASALDKDRAVEDKPTGRLSDKKLHEILLILVELLEITPDTWIEGEKTD